MFLSKKYYTCSVQGVHENIGILTAKDSLIKLKASFIMKLSTRSVPFLRYHVLLHLHLKLFDYRTLRTLYKNISKTVCCTE